MTNILLIDDAEYQYDVIRDILAALPQGFVVDWASNIADALTAIQHKQYEVCLVDYDLGEENGLNFIRQAIATGYTTPMIVLTGRSSRALAIEAMESGAMDYLDKTDMRIDTLERIIRYALERSRVMKELRDSETFLRHVLDNIAVGVFVWQADRLVYTNPTLCSLTGYESHELSAVSFLDIVTPEFLEPIHHALPHISQMEIRLRSKETQEIWAYLNLLPIEYRGQQAILGALVDITRNKQMGLAIQESEERYRDLFENTSDLIQSLSPDGHLEFVNRAWRERLGYNEQEIAQISFEDVIHPDALADFQEFGERLRHGESFKNIETILITKSGEPIRVEGDLATTIVDRLPGSTRGIFHDITERKRAEETLRRQNEYLTVLHEVTLDLFNRRHIDDLLQSVVEHAAKIIDAPFAEIMFNEGDKLWVRSCTNNQPFLRDDRVTRDEARLTWQAFDTGEVVVLEDYSTWPHRRPVYNGRPVHAIACFPITIGKNSIGVLDVSRSVPKQPFTSEQIQHGILFAQLVAIVLENNRLHEAAAREIEQRKQTEEALRESQRFVERITNTVPDIIFVFDIMEQSVLYANQGLEKTLSYTPEQIINMKSSISTELIHPDDLAMLLTPDYALGAMDDNGIIDMEFRIRHASGEWRWMSAQVVVFNRFPNGTPHHMLGIAQDVTERKRVMQSEREQRAIAEALLDTAATLNSTLQFNEVLDRILANVSKVVPHDRAYMMLVENGVCRVVGHRGFTPDRIARMRQLRLNIIEIPQLRQMAESLHPITIADKNELSTIIGEDNILSWLGAPVVQDDDVIGFIVLENATPDFFTHQHTDWLKAFTDQSALAIQNARSFEGAAAEERQRLARELHDAVSQTLFSASMISDTLTLLIDHNIAETRAGLHELSRLTRGALAEMRTLLVELRPTALLDSDFNILLTHLVDSLRTRTHADISLAITGTQYEIESEAKVNLYRITQEALNNIIKHAQASRIQATIAYTPKTVAIRVEDNGRGFHPHTISADHMGIRIMHERAAHAKIALTVTSETDQGTVVEAIWRNIHEYEP